MKSIEDKFLTTEQMQRAPKVSLGEPKLASTLEGSEVSPSKIESHKFTEESNYMSQKGPGQSSANFMEENRDPSQGGRDPRRRTRTYKKRETTETEA